MVRSTYQATLRKLGFVPIELEQAAIVEVETSVPADPSDPIVAQVIAIRDDDRPLIFVRVGKYSLTITIARDDEGEGWIRYGSVDLTPYEFQELVLETRRLQ